MEPPDPISNSEVKRLRADGSVALVHARVGHRQGLYPKGQSERTGPFPLRRIEAALAIVSASEPWSRGTMRFRTLGHRQGLYFFPEAPGRRAMQVQPLRAAGPNNSSPSADLGIEGARFSCAAISAASGYNAALDELGCSARRRRSS